MDLHAFWQWTPTFLVQPRPQRDSTIGHPRSPTTCFHVSPQCSPTSIHSTSPHISTVRLHAYPRSAPILAHNIDPYASTTPTHQCPRQASTRFHGLCPHLPTTLTHLCPQCRPTLVHDIRPAASTTPAHPYPRHGSMHVHGESPHASTTGSQQCPQHRPTDVHDTLPHISTRRLHTFPHSASIDVHDLCPQTHVESHAFPRSLVVAQETGWKSTRFHCKVGRPGHVRCGSPSWPHALCEVRHGHAYMWARCALSHVDPHVYVDATHMPTLRCGSECAPSALRDTSTRRHGRPHVVRACPRRVVDSHVFVWVWVDIRGRDIACVRHGPTRKGSKV